MGWHWNRSGHKEAQILGSEVYTLILASKKGINFFVQENRILRLTRRFYLIKDRFYFSEVENPYEIKKHHRENDIDDNAMTNMFRSENACAIQEHPVRWLKDRIIYFQNVCKII